MRRAALVAIAACALSVWASPAASAATPRGCHSQSATNLFLRHGIHTVRVNRITCGRAVRALRRWARNGYPNAGPRGWRCRARRPEGQARRVRCTRRGARAMRFRVGGG
jgi:hypothetical protein